MLYITPLKLIYFMAGSWYLLIPFTYFVLPPTPSPLATTHLFPVPTNLFFVLFYLFICLFSHVSENKQYLSFSV